VVTVNITQIFFGTLEGKYVGTEFDVVKADGSVAFHGSGIFTGDVAGTPATGTYRYEGIARANKFHATWSLRASPLNCSPLSRGLVLGLHSSTACPTSAPTAFSRAPKRVR
jgi:hypothetical protein